MFNLKDKKISTKIMVVICCFVILFVASLGVSLAGLDKNDRLVQAVLGDQEQSLFIAAVAAEKKTRLHQRAFEIGVETDATRWATLQQAFLDEIAGLRTSMGKLKPLMDGEDMKSFAPIESGLTTYIHLEAKGYVERSRGNAKAYRDLLEGDMATAFEILDKSFDALIAKQDHDMDSAGVELHASAYQTLWQSVALSVVGLLLTIAGALVLVSRQITKPVEILTSAMAELAEGKSSGNGSQRRNWRNGSSAAGVQEQRAEAGDE